MKKIIFLLLFLLSLSSIGYIVYFLYHPSACAIANVTEEKKQSYRIALFAPAVHAAMDEIEAGFTETMNQSKQATYHFDFYNGNGNPTLIRSEAEEIVRKEYDLVFTIGTACSKITKEIMAKKNSSVPLVFCAIDDPVALHLIKSLHSSENNVTGLTIAEQHAEQVRFLKFFKPEITTVLLVYNPKESSGSEKNKQSLEAALNAYNIQLRIVEIDNANEIQQKVPSFLPNCETLIIFTDHTACAGIDMLVKLCNQYHVTLYASTLSMGNRGAALCYGVHEADHGVESAKKARMILEDHAQPSDIPVAAVANYKIKINKKTMQEQNLIVEQTLLSILGIVEVIEKEK